MHNQPGLELTSSPGLPSRAWTRAGRLEESCPITSSSRNEKLRNRPVRRRRASVYRFFSAQIGSGDRHYLPGFHSFYNADTRPRWINCCGYIGGSDFLALLEIDNAPYR